MRRILVVDDEEKLRKLLGAQLKHEGYETSLAEDAKSAFQILANLTVDVVLLDIVLPGVSGIDVLKKIHLASPETLVIMMTGQPTVDSAVDAVKAGAHDYLYKPITKDQLLKSVNSALILKELAEDKKRLEQENEAYRKQLEEMLQIQNKALHKSQQFNDKIIKNSKDLIFILNAEGYLLFINPWGQQVLNIEDITLALGDVWHKLWTIASRQVAENGLQLALRGENSSFQGNLNNDSYTSRLWDVAMTPIVDESQKIEQVLVVARDITRFSGA